MSPSLKDFEGELGAKVKIGDRLIIITKPLFGLPLRHFEVVETDIDCHYYFLGRIRLGAPTKGISVREINRNGISLGKPFIVSTSDDRWSAVIPNANRETVETSPT